MNAFDCIKAFSETDFTEDLKKFDAPTQIIHGDATRLSQLELLLSLLPNSYLMQPQEFAQTHLMV